MADSVYKVIELVGTSTDPGSGRRMRRSTRRRSTLRDLRVAEVEQLDVSLDEDGTKTYRRSSACRSSTTAATDSFRHSTARASPTARLGGSDGASDTLPGRWTSGTRPPSSSSAPSSASGSATCSRASAPSRTARTGTPAAPGTPAGSACCSTPGTRASTGPRSTAAAGATPTEHLIFIEETERARAPVRRRELRRPPARRARRSSPRRPTSRRRSTCPASSRASTCGARASPSPNAGSDLASLRTPRGARRRRLRAQRPEDLDQLRPHRRLLRDARAHRSRGARSTRASRWLIVPMDPPGIDVRPLETMDGTAEFCEVFFDDVRVPVANRVGDENDGWRVTNVTLSFERGTAFVSDVLESMELVRDLADLAEDDHQQRRDALGGRRAAARARPHRRRVRRAVGAHEAQHLAGATHRPGRRRAATCSSSRTPTCASTSATSPCACSTARRSRSTT